MSNSEAWGIRDTGILLRFAAVLVEIAPGSLVRTLALILCVGLTEGIGLLFLIPLLHMVGLNVDQGATARVVEWMSAAFNTFAITPTLTGVLLAYVLVVTAQALLQRWQVRSAVALDYRVVHELRRRLYRAVTNANWLYFSRHRSSDFAHALTGEIGRAGAATGQVLLLVSQILVGLVYVLIAMQLSATMTAIAFACGAALLLLLRAGASKSQASGEVLSEAGRELYATVSDDLGGMKTAKSYGAEDRNFARFSEKSERVGHTYMEAMYGHADMRAAFAIGSVLVLSLIVYLAVRVVALAPVEILLLIFVFSRLVPKFASVQQGYHQLVHALPAFATVLGTIERAEAAAERSGGRGESIELEHGVQLDRVSFSYGSDTEARALVGLDLRIPARQTTALVGPSGGGKSTVADVVMGLIQPDKGSVTIDGVPIGTEQLKAWRESIGYVPQDTFLFHDTLRANLLWANPGASEEAIWEALRLAAADGFVSQLPQALETVLGDRGVRLSGGERQRIALARALLRKPSLLVLDEATSALDSENERRIRQAIGELHGRMTILLITHRLSTARDADTIYMLEGGQLVDSGEWTELISRSNGRFRAFWAAQAGEGNSPLALIADEPAQSAALGR